MAHGSEVPEAPNVPAQGLTSRLKRLILGKPRDVEEPGVFQKLSLIAFLAWVGLGADGLSSSSYGPEEAFKALGDHKFLAVGLAVATALTVFVLSAAYKRIIEHFPFGGGGYVVASRVLGSRVGAVSGQALIIDYVLTITISIAAGADAVFSFLPVTWHAWKLPVKFLAIILLMVMNLRGVKESTQVLAPIFLTFLVTHAILIAGAIATRVHEVPVVVHEVATGYSGGLAQLGLAGMFLLLMRAYSMGAGTYTGIEAVSNGLMIMREPKVETGKRTMTLMAASLAITAGGIIFVYLLLHVSPVAGKTMNAVLVERFAGSFSLAGLPIGYWFVLVTLISEALLLFVAAQTGFVGGPQLMANMATDSYLPHRFAQLSDRLTMQNGVLLMGGASLLALLYTRGAVSYLVIMYAINVFVTFSLSQLAMCRYWWRDRRKHSTWKKQIGIHVVGLILCVFILVMTIYEKFGEGAWRTLVVTGLLVGLCFLIRRHYRRVVRSLRRLNEIFGQIPATANPGEVTKLDPTAPTAVLMVGSYAGLGIHALLSIQRLFPHYYKNFLFLSVGVVDAATFKGVEEVERVRAHTEESLVRYVELARRLGLPADHRMRIGTEVVAEMEELAKEVSREFPRAMFFAGRLIFEEEKWYQRLLHNETAYQLQRRLQFSGLNVIVLPIRVMSAAA